MRDWLLQRFTAVFLAAYSIVVAVICFRPGGVDYSTWDQIFHNPFMQGATLLALICLVVHAWVGLWTIATDYIHHVVVRNIFLGLVFLALFSYVSWGAFILWGNLS